MKETPRRDTKEREEKNREKEGNKNAQVVGKLEEFSKAEKECNCSQSIKLLTSASTPGE